MNDDGYSLMRSSTEQLKQYIKELNELKERKRIFCEFDFDSIIVKAEYPDSLDS